MPKANTTIKMDGGASAGDSIATIDIPEDGLLLNASIYISGRGPSANTAMMRAELNFGSSNSFDNNDVRTVISHVMWDVGDIQTAEAAISHPPHTTFFPDGLIVFAGERIHLHAEAAGFTFQEAVALLVFRFKSARTSRRC